MKHITEEQFNAIEVGDVAILRDDLVDDQHYGADVYVEEMAHCSGVIANLWHGYDEVGADGFNLTQQMISRVLKKGTPEHKRHMAMQPWAHQEAPIAKPVETKEIVVYIGVDGDGMHACSDGLGSFEQTWYSNTDMNVEDYVIGLLPDSAWEGLNSTADGQRKITLSVSISKIEKA